MALIKSAWEIALEKTEDLQADPAKIKRDRLVKEGRQLAASFLLDIDVTKEETAEKFGSCPAEDRDAVKEGMTLTLLANLTLPRSEQFKDSFAKVRELSTILAPGNEEIDGLMSQMEGFFSQYLQNQKDLIEQMKQQFGPQLEQKQAQLRQQYGPDFILHPEQDPEFMKLLDKNLSQLDSQYSSILDQAKGRIKEILGVR
jgi:hypothetical protein